MTARAMLMGACLALPLAAYGGAAALAGQPEGTQTITVPAGAVVLVLPGAAMPVVASAAAAPADDPLLRMVAAQDAMMHSMMDEMNAAFTQPLWPMQMDQAIRAAFAGVPMGGAGSGTMITAVSNGPGVCSERITYAYPANGAKPQVTLTRSGNACGALGVPGPRDVVQTPPSRTPDAPSAAPARGPHLWTISDPPREIVTSGTPRS